MVKYGKGRGLGGVGPGKEGCNGGSGWGREGKGRVRGEGYEKGAFQCKLQGMV